MSFKMTTASLSALLVVAVATLCFETPNAATVTADKLNLETFSGGQAGVSLNATELVIHNVTSTRGGVMTHFWLTGGNKTNIDNAIVTIYVDGQVVAQFQPNMAGGTGFVDYDTECDLGNCPEANSNWGNQWIGKGSGMGGWYNNFRVPFNKSLVATIKSFESSIVLQDDKCFIEKDIDYWGNDLPNEQIPNVPDVDTCCKLCSQTPGCAAFTYHPPGAESAETCFLKTTSAGRRPSPGNYSGSIGWRLRQGFDIWDTPIASVNNTSSAKACAKACDSNAQCKAFAYHDESDAVAPLTCNLFSSGDNIVNSATTSYMGCHSSECGAMASGDMSVFVLVRGVLGPAPISFNGVQLPSSARLVVQNRWALLKPLDYYDFVHIEKGSGMVAMSTLSVVSGNQNFMEGCFHLFAPLTAAFPGQILATGTEDFYNSGYYFIDAFPQHLPSTGFTFNKSFNKERHGNITQGVLWTAYRLHTVDYMAFSGGGGAAMRWRNGDVADPDRGKCRHEGSGQPVGDPQPSYVRSLSYTYVW